MFVNRTALAWTRAAELVVGRSPAALPSSVNGHTPAFIDAVNFERDWRPAFVDGLAQLVGAVRHPRAALRAAFHGH